MYSFALLQAIPLFTMEQSSLVQMDGNLVPSRLSHFDLENVKCGRQNGGTNHAGKFSFNGDEYYVKVSSGGAVAEDQIRSEVLATKLYALAEDNLLRDQFLENHLIEIDDPTFTKCPGFAGQRYAIATKWVNDMKHIDVEEMAKLDGVTRGLAMDVWLAHYDHVGNGGASSLNIKKRNNKAYRIDFGGVFEWKASGRRKGSYVKDILFEDNAAKEWKQYQIQGHPFMTPRAFVFADMTLEEKIASLQVVTGIRENAIRDAVADTFPPELPCLDENNQPIANCNRVDQLQDLLVARQTSLYNAMLYEQQMLGKAGEVSNSDIERFHQDFDGVLGAEYIEMSVFKADLAIFCKIDFIHLHDGTKGTIKQAQMWDQLKTHGKFKKWLNYSVPEPLQKTLEKNGITKGGSLALKIQKMVQMSEEEKASIGKIKDSLCK